MCVTLSQHICVSFYSCNGNSRRLQGGSSSPVTSHLPSTAARDLPPRSDRWRPCSGPGLRAPGPITVKARFSSPHKPSPTCPSHHCSQLFPDPVSHSLLSTAAALVPPTHWGVPTSGPILPETVPPLLSPTLSLGFEIWTQRHFFRRRGHFIYTYICAHTYTLLKRHRGGR